MKDYLEKILTSRVYDVAVETPLENAPGLSARLGCSVLLKREDMQPVFSFKLRGAYNKMSRLSAEELERGVVAASAGNHAQGVALSAKVLGCRALIVMPVTTPQIKIDAVKSHGGEVVLYGDSYSDASAYADQLVKSTGAVYIHPYDDPDVIAGQGTIAMEILRQHPGHIDGVFVPVGGGGLIAGIGSYIKRLKPEIKIIAVEPTDSCALSQSLDVGYRVELKDVGLFADGVAVKKVGTETFRICCDVVDEVVLVDTDQTCAAIKDVFEDTRSIMEPAGALSVAGIKAYQDRIPGGKYVAILSGANMNFDRLRHVSERSELGEKREAVIAAIIPERPGSFKKFCSLLGSRSVTEFNYRYSDNRRAAIFVGIQIQKAGETAELMKAFASAGIEAADLSDNETAKLHVRHMVGGRARIEDERVFRFEFPERPGALMRFLEHLRSDWNISLFHYRNHGADYGRILAGIQVPDTDYGEFQSFLDGLGYPYSEETDNPAYKLFISPV